MTLLNTSSNQAESPNTSTGELSQPNAWDQYTRKEYRQGYPKATEAQIDTLMAAEKATGTGAWNLPMAEAMLKMTPEQQQSYYDAPKAEKSAMFKTVGFSMELAQDHPMALNYTQPKIKPVDPEAVAPSFRTPMAS